MSTTPNPKRYRYQHWPSCMVESETGEYVKFEDIAPAPHQPDQLDAATTRADIECVVAALETVVRLGMSDYYTSTDQERQITEALSAARRVRDAVGLLDKLPCLRTLSTETLAPYESTAEMLLGGDASDPESAGKMMRQLLCYLYDAVRLKAALAASPSQPGGRHRAET